MLNKDYKHPSLTRFIFLLLITAGIYLYYYLRNVSKALEIPEKCVAQLQAALLTLKLSLYYFIFDLHYQLYAKMTGSESTIFDILSTIYPWLVLFSFFAVLLLLAFSINADLLKNKSQLAVAIILNIFYLDYQIANLQTKPRKFVSYILPTFFVIFVVIAERNISAHLNQQLKNLETQMQELQNLKNQLEGLY